MSGEAVVRKAHEILSGAMRGKSGAWSWECSLDVKLALLDTMTELAQFSKSDIADKVRRTYLPGGFTFMGLPAEVVRGAGVLRLVMDMGEIEE